MVEVRILGPLEVVHAGTPVALGGTKQRAVFAMLVLRVNRVVSMDFLVDGLWGTAPPTDPINVVQVYLSRLRKALHPAGTRDTDDGRVIRRKPGYLLQLDPEHLDLHRFQRLTREGSQLLPSSPEAAAAALSDALGLWRGVPLAEFTEEPFAGNEVTRLEESRLTALTARIRADLAVGRHAELVGELEDLTGRYPLHEGLRGQLMLSLYRSGRQAEALEAYRRAREVFADELGIDPGRDLQDLEAAVLAHQPDLDWTPPPPTTTMSTPLIAGDLRAGTAHSADHSGNAAPRPLRVSNVPARNPHFTGRTALLDRLHQQLRADPAAVVVLALYGLGGVGKTQLAIEYAHRHTADYDLMWWIDAEQAVLVPPQFAALARILDLPDRGLPADVVRRVLGELTQCRNWLLIFDNAERSDEVAAYLPGGPGHVLVTSRSPVWGALGGRVEIDVLTRADTTALLQARIPELTADLADKLAAELGDLPLAVAQAAAYLEQTALPPSDYLRRFRTHRAALLARGDILGYHGRVDTAWALSLERLQSANPTSVALLELCAFLAPEPIPLTLFTNRPDIFDQPLQAAAADLDTLADAVGAAVGYSLVRRHPHGFSLHRLLQAVIRNRLPPDRQSSVSASVVKLLSAAHPGDPHNPANWPAYEALAPHVLAAGPQGDDQPTYRRLQLSTFDYLSIQGDARATANLASQLRQRWHQVLGPDHPDTLASSGAAAFALAWLGEHQQALQLNQETLRRSQGALGSDHVVSLRMATYLTLTLVWLGEAAQAADLGQDTLRRCRTVLGPDHPLTLVSGAAVTSALTWLGDLSQAAELGQDTLRRCRTVLGPDHPDTLRIGAALTLALAQLGNYGNASSLGEDTLHRCQRILGPDHRVTVIAAISLVSALTGLDRTEALALAEDTLHRSRQMLGLHNGITLVAGMALTNALTAMGEHEQAQRVGQDILQQSRKVLNPNNLITRTLTQLLGSDDSESQ